MFFLWLLSRDLFRENPVSETKLSATFQKCSNWMRTRLSRHPVYLYPALFTHGVSSRERNPFHNSILFNAARILIPLEEIKQENRRQLADASYLPKIV